ncbi:hypothetical protein BDW02DRAFT_313700 [Decorospora gaudefroyi]|uniref:Uncharacterized protein n=1 Tax=Decorospora gaudefroyi TaxID=184978 RepID=A0A6A5KFE7_9PLEO|nr:hypothetical protein BDW02DRAFT_313700 [Decorospora gaudefroyi]
MLVSKAFAEDASHVWKQRVEPKLVPTLNVDVVGNGTSSYRPLVGILAKWLYLPSTFKAAEQMDIRIRHLDRGLRPSQNAKHHTRYCATRRSALVKDGKYTIQRPEREEGCFVAPHIHPRRNRRLSPLQIKNNPSYAPRDLHCVCWGFVRIGNALVNAGGRPSHLARK